ncbi:type II secretion protein [Aliivibrio sifiae]|uniref:Type II secretion protein n=2 Tax=Aliivibrio sifiae TaxID=566293 RepID=A0A2S7XFF7_9GAMM|nr:pullulanase-type alpha-1,6-glucosidase [Aliivibrio sifiae]PQJ90098.1 type II secretion protein [Aliivibrio sifiae]
MNKIFKPSYLAKSILTVITSSMLFGCNSPSGDIEKPVESNNTVKVYFKSTSSNYNNPSLYVWNDDNCGAYLGDNPDAKDWAIGIKPDGEDTEFGVYWSLNVDKKHPSQCVNFIPRIGENNTKPLNDFNGKVDLFQTNTSGEVFTQEGISSVYPELIPTGDIPANHARVYMNTPDADANAFRLHVWNEGSCTNLDTTNSAWPGIEPSGVSDTYGVYWDIPINSTDNCLNIIPNTKFDGDYQSANLKIEFEKTTAIGNVAFLFKGTDKVYYDPMANKPVNSIELLGASAIFASDNTLLINSKDATKIELFYAKNAGMVFDSKTRKVIGSDNVISSKTLSRSDTWKGSEEKPHLASDFIAFNIDFSQADITLKEALKGQLILVASNATGVIKATEVQTASALDSLYASQAVNEKFGALINSDGSTTFRLWAPTSQSVVLVSYDNSKQESRKIPMIFNQTTGSWVAENTELTHGDFYKYEVTVYHPATDKIETYQVTDPYSLSLSTNSELSQVIDLKNAEVVPAGWNNLTSPHSQTNPAEFILYEAHIRDFSALEQSIPTDSRGKYSAFSQADSAPVKHLKSLSDSGVSHLHLLPTFDIATINEDNTQIANIDESFTKLCGLKPTIKDDKDFGSYCSGNDSIASVFTAMLAKDSPENAVIQRLNSYVIDVDGFNWGYDPYHYTVPEGSYSSNPDGMIRIKEFREMVMAIKNDIGMNVVMDIVYNHTNEAGVSDKSVLDRIVPWYYQRLNEITGSVENSTCCSNTAPENAMMGKLISDSLVVWAQDYKIDAFRWDLMGHHPKTQILETLAAVKAVDPKTYFYGEGWNFGEVGNDRQFTQATQPNMYGTGVGTFSDRLRDSVRGGGPFDSEMGLRENQGFGNGAFILPNEQNKTNKETALHLADLTRLGMAGNLSDFTFVDSKNKSIKGSELDYNGQPAGYAKDAWEIQNYVSKHDNQTLWDNNQYKIGYDVSAEIRTRMQAVSLATAMLGQGVPFTHMGSELLRSKSMQRDSYDSGDWYNRVDFTAQDNNWDVGLPREDKDGSNWTVIQGVINNSAENATPTPANIQAMKAFYEEFASLRASSGLLTLGHGDKIIKRVKFHNTGSNQTVGVIVMSIDNSGNNYDTSIDQERDGLVVVVNANPAAINEFANFDATGYTLHSIQAANGAKSIARNDSKSSSVTNNKLNTPAWSVAVFEKRHN